MDDCEDFYNANDDDNDEYDGNDDDNDKETRLATTREDAKASKKFNS